MQSTNKMHLEEEQLACFRLKFLSKIESGYCKLVKFLSFDTHYYSIM